MGDDFYDLDENEEENLSLVAKLKKWLLGSKKSGDAADGLYGIDESEMSGLSGADNPYDDNADSPSSHTHHWHPFGFVWWEWLVIMVEIILVTYTVLAFIGLAPLF